MKRTSIAITCSAALLLASCGGGGGSGDAPGAGGGAGEPAVLKLHKLELAQTHVLPAQGKVWAQPNGKSLDLHYVGGRAALAVVDIGAGTFGDLRLEGRIGSQALGDVSLQDNNALPPTEAGGERYSATARAALLPAAWLRPGLELRVAATNAQATAWQPIAVGADTTFAIRTLPFYLFGATEQLVGLQTASVPDAKALDELRAKWPIGNLSVAAHAGQRIDWPQLVIGPRNGNAAYVMSSAEDRLNGFDPIAAVLGAVSRLREASGEADLAYQYYGALVQRNRDGSLAGAGGGLGGGHAGAGDHTYRGIFIHEQGHAFGLPHAGESYAAGSGYPYPGGSLNGSAWGYDQMRAQFMPTFVPAGAEQLSRCASQTYAGTPRQMDAKGRCIKQDPMQSGSGDQVAGDAYTIFSDYNAARIQRYLEGETSLNSDGTRRYDGGRIVESATHASGYKRWDKIDNAWVAFDPGVDSNKGLYGVNGGFPQAKGVPVYTMFFTRSNAETAGATQIYPVLGPYSGSLLRTFDPTSAADLASMQPNTGPHPWYCHASGCDFTLRLSYANGSVRHVAVQGGFRGWFKPETAPAASASDPLSGDSFRLFAVNVPADAAIRKVELLSTPTVWKGLPAAPQVLATRQLP